MLRLSVITVNVPDFPKFYIEFSQLLNIKYNENKIMTFSMPPTRSEIFSKKLLHLNIEAGFLVKKLFSSRK